MGIGIGADTVLYYAVGLLLLYLLGSSIVRVLKLPIKIMMTVIFNSIIGGLVLFIMNVFGFEIGINPWNALLIGILGVPGLIALIIIKIML